VTRLRQKRRNVAESKAEGEHIILRVSRNEDEHRFKVERRLKTSKGHRAHREASRAKSRESEREDSSAAAVRFLLTLEGARGEQVTSWRVAVARASLAGGRRRSGRVGASGGLVGRGRWGRWRVA